MTFQKATPEHLANIQRFKNVLFRQSLNDFINERKGGMLPCKCDPIKCRGHIAIKKRHGAEEGSFGTNDGLGLVRERSS